MSLWSNGGSTYRSLLKVPLASELTRKRNLLDSIQQKLIIIIQQKLILLDYDKMPKSIRQKLILSDIIRQKLILPDYPVKVDFVGL